MTELPWIDDLIGFAIERTHYTNRIFYCDFFSVSFDKFHKKCSCFIPKTERFDAFLKPPGTKNSQMSARRMSNKQVPIANIVSESVHCCHTPTFHSFESITKDVKFRMPAGRFLYIARIGFMPPCAEREAHGLAFFTCYENFHVSSPFLFIAIALREFPGGERAERNGALFDLHLGILEQ
nr:MAG TPA: hypothetical protein [Caudoviricetes sp.]